MIEEHQVENVGSGCKKYYTGDVTIGRIGAGAEVTVRDGILRVKDSVLQGAHINVEKSSQAQGSNFPQSQFQNIKVGSGSCRAIGNIGTATNIFFHGTSTRTSTPIRNIKNANNVTIFGDGSVTSVTIDGKPVQQLNTDQKKVGIVVDGILSNKVKIECGGNIKINNFIADGVNLCADGIIMTEGVGSHCLFISKGAYINVGDVGVSVLKAFQGSITVRGNVETGANLKAFQGNITVGGDVKTGANLKASQGNITVGGNVKTGASLKASQGNITVRGGVKTGANLKASQGRIKVGKAEYGAKLKALQGSIEVGEWVVRGANLNAPQESIEVEERGKHKDKLTGETLEYLQSFYRKSTTYSEEFKKYKIDDEDKEFANLLCPISLCVANIPVLLKGDGPPVVFEFHSLIEIINSNVGEEIGTHPLTRKPFYRNEIRPAYEANEKIKSIIEDAKIKSRQENGEEIECVECYLYQVGGPK